MRMKSKDRVVTASIGLKLSTIDMIEHRAADQKMTFSAVGRELIEKALQELVPPLPASDTPEVSVERSSAPI